MARSSRLRAVRASPSEKRAKYVSISSSRSGDCVDVVATARWRMRRRSCSRRSSRVKVRHLLSRADMTLKLGFSVVAAISVMVPDSTGPRKASCCVLLKRCSSSQKTMVLRPASCRSRAASPKILRTSSSFVLVLLISTKRAPDVLAISRAMVVLPVPGRPHSTIEGSRPSSTMPRRIPPGPTRSCPHTSSREVGRMRSAKGMASSTALSRRCLFTAAGDSPFFPSPSPSSCDRFGGVLGLSCGACCGSGGLGDGGFWPCVAVKKRCVSFFTGPLSAAMCSLQSLSRCSLILLSTTGFWQMGQSNIVVA